MRPRLTASSTASSIRSRREHHEAERVDQALGRAPRAARPRACRRSRRHESPSSPSADARAPAALLRRGASASSARSTSRRRLLRAEVETWRGGRRSSRGDAEADFARALTTSRAWSRTSSASRRLRAAAAAPIAREPDASRPLELLESAMSSPPRRYLRGRDYPMPNAAVTGAWSDSRSSRSAVAHSACRATGAPSGRRPRTSRWSIAVGRRLAGAGRAARAARSNASGALRRAQVQVAAEDQRASPDHCHRELARPRSTSRGCARGRRCSRAGWRRPASRRRGARGGPRSARGARAGDGEREARAPRRSATAARTRIWFEPPSFDAIRSGFSRASAARSEGELSCATVSTERAARPGRAAERRAASAAAPPGAARRPSSRPARTAANSRRAGG